MVDDSDDEEKKKRGVLEWLLGMWEDVSQFSENLGGAKETEGPLGSDGLPGGGPGDVRYINMDANPYSTGYFVDPSGRFREMGRGPKKGPTIAEMMGGLPAPPTKVVEFQREIGIGDVTFTDTEGRQHIGQKTMLYRGTVTVSEGMAPEQVEKAIDGAVGEKYFDNKRGGFEGLPVTTVNPANPLKSPVTGIVAGVAPKRQGR